MNALEKNGNEYGVDLGIEPRSLRLKPARYATTPTASIRYTNEKMKLYKTNKQHPENKKKSAF